MLDLIQMCSLLQSVLVTNVYYGRYGLSYGIFVNYSTRLALCHFKNIAIQAFTWMISSEIR